MLIYDMNVKRDFTATTVVVHRRKVLLHHHRKLGLLLPLGGHIEPDELPDDAALREVREESGFRVTLHEPSPLWPLTDVRQLARPVAVLLEDIGPNHQHVDLIYLATLADESEYPAGSGTEELVWLTAEEVELMEMPENVRALCRYALAVLSGSDLNDLLLQDGPRLA